MSQHTTLEQDLQVAFAYHQQNKLAEAEDVYRKILNAYPENAEVSHNLGVLLLQKERAREALPYFQKARNNCPQNGLHWLSLAQCHIRLKDYQLAASVLDEVESKGLKHKRIEELRNDISRGEGCAGSYENSLPPDYIEANYLRESGKWQKAVSAAQKLTETNPSSADAWALLGLALLQVNRLNEVDIALRRAYQLEAENVLVLRALANLALRRGQLEEAEKLAKVALNRNQRCARTLVTLASAFIGLQRLDEAELALKRALSIEDLAEVRANFAILEMRRNNYAAAIQNARLATEKKPFLSAVWQILAGLYQMTGNVDLSTDALEHLLIYDSENVAALSNLGENYRKAGRLDMALPILEKATTKFPTYINAWINYGTTLQDLGKTGEAVTVYEKILEIDPGRGEVLNNLGVLYEEEGDWEKALAAFTSAAQLLPDKGDIQANLGCALVHIGRLEAAEEVLRLASILEPSNTACKLGWSLISARKNNPEEAERWLREAIQSRPTNPELWCHLGAMMVRAQRVDEAEASFAKALSLRADIQAGLQGMATVLITKGNGVHALELSMRSLRVKETLEAKNSFVYSLKLVQFVKENTEAIYFSHRAIEEAWTRPSELVAPIASLVKVNEIISSCVSRVVKSWPARLTENELYGGSGKIEQVGANELLCCLMENAPVSDVDLEKMLTMARYALLQAANCAEAITDVPTGELLRYYCALARQCFINEYVFGYTYEEDLLASSLRERVEEALASGSPVPIIWLVAVSTYYPLFSLLRSELLLGMQWPEIVIALLVQQVKEPIEERQLSATIPSLTIVDDPVSLLVQQQYEENPYPRWIRSPIATRPIGLNNAIRSRFPYSPYVPLSNDGAVDVLIAGCGTGQHPIGMAPQFRGAKVLAIDLSFASLGYAKRKTIEAGVQNIEYAQADITNLGKLTRRFDLIESMGVLHHLEDPMLGWRELLKLLRPNGLMRLGFYSEIARREIVEARGYISEKGYSTSQEGIRKFRQDLIRAGSELPFYSLTASRDFYATSACRDLLFHVQEHRFTLPKIKSCLDELGLTFIGFTLDPDVLNRYLQRFPEDRSMTDLCSWNEFETENPRTFAGMYQFWVQKAKV